MRHRTGMGRMVGQSQDMAHRIMTIAATTVRLMSTGVSVTMVGTTVAAMNAMVTVVIMVMTVVTDMAMDAMAIKRI